MVSSLVSLPSIQKQAMFVKFFTEKKFYERGQFRYTGFGFVPYPSIQKHTTFIEFFLFGFFTNVDYGFFQGIALLLADYFIVDCDTRLNFQASAVDFSVKSAAFLTFCQVRSNCDRKKFTPRKELILFQKITFWVTIA